MTNISLSPAGWQEPAPILDRLVDELAERHYAVVDHFFSAEEAALLRNELLSQFQQGVFKLAGTGQATDFQVDGRIRGDFIRWIEKDTLPPACRFFHERLTLLIEHLNFSLFLGIKSEEFHFACYQPGSFYKRHLDTFHKDGSRKISMIFYLNEDWEPSQGGALRIYESDENGNECHKDVWPISGRLACFRSDVVEHEVLPATRERLSITGWLKSHAPLI